LKTSGDSIVSQQGSPHFSFAEPKKKVSKNQEGIFVTKNEYPNPEPAVFPGRNQGFYNHAQNQ
jgi:hypothetical protein